MGSLLKCYICNATISYLNVQDQNCNIQITDIQILGAKYRGLFLQTFSMLQPFENGAKHFSSVLNSFEN